MRKRRRRYKPVNEGSLKDISKQFFSPIYQRFRAENQSAKSFFDELFDVENREISRWKVKEGFKIPGLLYLGGFVKIQGAGRRYVKRGLVIFVRMDKSNPTSVDVEFFAGKGKRDQCFCLDLSQWELIKLNLEQIKHDEFKSGYRDDLRSPPV